MTATSLESDPARSTAPESAAGGTATSGRATAERFHGYDRIFWLAYLSNGLTTVANAMMVRYADFVGVLGGEERQLGLIVGCGMIGSIAIRMVQGEAIDRYGSARVWQWSMVFYCLSLALHLTLSTAYGPAIFLVRILMQSSLAGIFGASITFVSIRVAPSRMAEIIGALGTSGFLGIMLGPSLSDWLGRGGATGAEFVTRLFVTALVVAVLATVATWFAGRHAPKPAPRRRPHLFTVVRRYHPLVLSIAAAAMGVGFSIPMTFLRPFAVERQMDGVAVFFVIYAGTAFVARIATRSLFERFGNRPWILSGMVLLSLSFATYVFVSSSWQLAIPATLAGVAHALLFPSVMAAGTAMFPRRFLGVATSFMLAMFDLGIFIGAPIVGAFLRAAKSHTTAAYPWMFGATAVVLASVTLLFHFSAAARSPRDVARPPI